MNDFHGQWKQFLESKKTLLSEVVLQEIEQNVLAEITDSNYERVKDWMAQADNIDDYSFAHMFDGKWRVAFPMQTYADEIIQDLIKFFEGAGYKVDFSTGTVSVEVETQKGTQERKTKIGKLLNRAAQISEKYTKFDQEYWRSVSDYEHRVSVPDDGGYVAHPRREELRKLKQKLYQQWQKLFGRNSEIINHVDAKKLLNFWNAKSEYYRTHPEDIMTASKFSIVVSRHPIDVVRMSDFNKIHSCHSEGSGYFDCAMAESKGHGPIAYVVETEQLEGIDLQDEEIFEDPSRRIEGAEPLARVRLRRFFNVDDDYDLAVPEEQTYGVGYVGFREAVSDWALAAQREYLEQNDPDIEFDRDEEGKLIGTGLPDMHDFVRKGGSYSDSYSSSMFNDFFHTTEYSGDVEDDSEQVGPNLADQYEEEREQIQTDADRRLQYVGVWSEVEGGDWDDDVYLSFGGSMAVEFHSEEFEILDSLPSEWQEQRVLYNQLGDALNDADIWYSDILFDNPWGQSNSQTLLIRFDLEIEHEFTPDGFSDFVDYAYDVDNKYKIVKDVIRQVLVENGHIEPSYTDSVLSKLESEEIEFENFDWEYDEGVLELKTDPQTDKFIIASMDRSSPDYKIFKELFSGVEYNEFRSNTFNDHLYKKLKSKEAEAQEYAAKQLVLPGIEGPKEKPHSIISMTLPMFVDFVIHVQTDDRDSTKLSLKAISLLPSSTHESNAEAALLMLEYLDKNMDFVLETAKLILEEMIVIDKDIKLETSIELRNSAKEFATKARESFPKDQKVNDAAIKLIDTIFDADRKGHAVPSNDIRALMNVLKIRIRNANPDIDPEELNETVKRIVLQTVKIAKLMLENKNKG